MPHLTGVFEEFPDLEKTPPAKIAAWIKTKLDSHFLTNFLGNRLLYPQTIPINEEELEIDLAILREGIKLKPTLVLDFQTNKLVFPQSLTERFPPLTRLAGAVIESLAVSGVSQIYIKDKTKLKLVGTLISPPDINKIFEKENAVKVIVDGIESVLNVNTISVSEIASPEVIIKIADTEYKVPGGELGVVIDLRKKAANE